MKVNLKNFPDVVSNFELINEKVYRHAVKEWKEAFERELHSKLKHYKALEKHMKQKLATTQVIKEILGEEK